MPGKGTKQLPRRSARVNAGINNRFDIYSQETPVKDRDEEAKAFTDWAKENTVLGDKWKESKAAETQSAQQSVFNFEEELTPITPQGSIVGDVVPGGSFEHSPVPPDFTPTRVVFPSETKEDKGEILNIEAREAIDGLVQRQRELSEQKNDIETLKRAVDNIVQQTAREIDALKEENDKLGKLVLIHREEIRALKKQRRKSYVPKDDVLSTIVDLTLE